MDFFEHQEYAVKRTGLLVFYFACAVLLITGALYLAAAFFFVHFGPEELDSVKEQFTGYWHPVVFLYVSAAVALTILIASFWKSFILSRRGGAGVAASLGARQAQPDTEAPEERRLMNVVEEMAIASGIPVPLVFIMDRENSINAFAAGFSHEDAVICVTAGCLKKLSRDELSAVVAHEFSHILNGDMRLNLKLMGVLFGILVIGIAGFAVFRGSLGMGAASSGYRTRHPYARNRRGGHPAAALFGLAIAAVGYMGVFFGNLIKNAVSRQRELLADASSVQFTRNPGAMAGALKKIGIFPTGSRINNPKAEEASHLFFAEGIESHIINVFSTHPPLADRIKRIDPSFDGKFPGYESVKEQFEADSGRPEEPASAFEQVFENPGEGGEEGFMQSVGNFGAEHVVFAAALLGSMSPGLKNAAHGARGSVLLVYALLLNEDPSARKKQLEYIKQESGAETAEEIRKLRADVEKVRSEGRLPLVDMAIPSLKKMSREDYLRFKAHVEFFVSADDRQSLFEYALQKILFKHLDAHFTGGKKGGAQYYSIKPLIPHCGNLMSVLAYFGNEDASSASTAFRTGMNKLGGGGIAMLPREGLRFEVIDKSLAALNLAAPQIKKKVLSACSACVWANRSVTVRESELLRVIADALDCPAPPGIAGAA